MDRYIYLAMTAAKHALQAQQLNANNLANANTPGFRADLDTLISQPVQGPGYASRVYSSEAGAGSDFKSGPIVSTGNDLDVAVSGSGWIAVQAPDGSEAYTRRGDLRVSSGGLLETGDGRPVLGDGGPIAVPPASHIAIGKDGTLSIVPTGEPARNLVVVGRIRLVNPPDGSLVKGDDGLFRLRSGGTAPPDASVELASGALESSNVNIADYLVRMIDDARRYEANVKLFSVAEQDDAASRRVLQSSGTG